MRPTSLSENAAASTSADEIAAPGGRRAPPRWAPHTERRAFVLTLAIGAFAVVAVLPAFRAWTGIDARLGGLAHDGYVELARSLAAGEGFVFEPGGATVFHRPPLYPSLITPVMWLPGSRHRAGIGLVDALLLACAVAATFRLGRRCFGPWVGSVAPLIMLAVPWVPWKIGIGMLPILQLTLFVLVADAMMSLPGLDPGSGRSDASGTLRRGAWIGLLGAALMLTHGGMLLTLMLLLAGAGVWLAWRGAWARVPTLLVALAVVVACVAPWTLRNRNVTGHWIPVAGNAGFAYFLAKVHWGQADEVEGFEMPTGLTLGTPAGLATLRSVGVGGPLEAHYHFYGLKDPDLDQALNRRMVADVLAEPMGFLGRVGLNTLEYWVPIVWPLVMTEDASVAQVLRRWPNKLARSALWLVFWVLVVRAVVRSRGIERQRALLLVAAILAFSASYVPVFASRSDYSLALVPVFSVLVARGIEGRGLAMRQGR